ncbi:MAG TPA: alpha/beta hydrolase [Acidimicrobiia bacterium]
MTATVVLVHGAWHGAWCWDHVAEQLRADDIPVVAIDLPGHGSSDADLGDLTVDAAALGAVLDGLDDAVVCGHSYGGAVISEGAASHPALRHLVYVCAIVLDAGESCTASVTAVEAVDAAALTSGIRIADDGTMTLDPSIAAEVLYHDCPADDVARALTLLDAQRMDSLQAPATRAAWRDAPTTYALCTEDRAIPPGLQRAFAARAGVVVEWPTSHSPFFARPELVTALLADRARAAT